MATRKKHEPQTIEHDETNGGKPSKSRAVAVPHDWQKELAKHAMKSKKLAEENASAAGNWLTFQGAQLRYKGMEIKNNQTDLIVLGAVNEYLYYDPKKPFDPDNPSQPICYAMSEVKGDMAPNEHSPKPQNGDCPSCQHNKFGTATTGSGRGKACKNQIRLAAIPWGNGNADALSEAEIGFAKISVTSVRNWAAYEAGLAKASCFYVTRMSVRSDAKTQFQVLFEEVKGPLTDSIMKIIAGRVREAEQALLPDNPYPPMEPRTASVPRGRGKAAPAKKKGKAAGKTAPKY